MSCGATCAQKPGRDECVAFILNLRNKNFLDVTLMRIFYWWLSSENSFIGVPRMIVVEWIKLNK